MVLWLHPSSLSSVPVLEDFHIGMSYQILNATHAVPWTECLELQLSAYLRPALDLTSASVILLWQHGAAHAH